MSKPGGDPFAGISLGDGLRRPKRHPACRRREAQPGSCSERENLIGDAKGKGASGSNREGESTDAPGRGGLLRSSDEAGVMLVERRERAIAIWLGSTGNGRNPMLNERRQPSRDGTSRMTRECQVRFCEGLGVKFPGPTAFADPRAMQRKRGRWRWALRFVPGPCHHRRANAALPRRKVALGSSPKAERYWALNPPRCEKPCRKATVVTLASGPKRRSSSRTSCNRACRKDAVGVVSRHWRKPACSARRLMPR